MLCRGTAPLEGIACMTAARIIELSHVIRDGQVTLPGFPPPQIGTFLSREASRERYAPGVEFHIATIEHDRQHRHVPRHAVPPLRRGRRSGRPLIQPSVCFDVEGIVVRAVGGGPIERDAFGGRDVARPRGAGPHGLGRALRHARLRRGHPPAIRRQWLARGRRRHPTASTSMTRRWAPSPIASWAPASDPEHLDHTCDETRPAHCPAASQRALPSWEHLARHGALPDSGFRVTALPPRIAGMGTFPVAIARPTIAARSGYRAGSAPSAR